MVIVSVSQQNIPQLPRINSQLPYGLQQKIDRLWVSGVDEQKPISCLHQVDRDITVAYIVQVSHLSLINL